MQHEAFFIKNLQEVCMCIMKKGKIIKCSNLLISELISINLDKIYMNFVLS